MADKGEARARKAMATLLQHVDFDTTTEGSTAALWSKPTTHFDTAMKQSNRESLCERLVCSAGAVPSSWIVVR